MLSSHGQAIHHHLSASQITTHHTVHRCCPRSHCHHHSATGSGCSSRSGRGTRPPHTPGGLWAEQSGCCRQWGQCLGAQQIAVQSRAVRQLQGCPGDQEKVAVSWGVGRGPSLITRGGDGTGPRTEDPKADMGLGTSLSD